MNYHADDLKDSIDGYPDNVFIMIAIVIIIIIIINTSNDLRLLATTRSSSSSSRILVSPTWDVIAVIISFIINSVIISITVISYDS